MAMRGQLEFVVSEMGKTDARGDIDRRLGEALESLRKDVMRVEIWATALAGFARPIPDYDIEERFHLQSSAKNVSKNKP